MALPEDYSNTAKYVGVVIAELAATSGPIHNFKNRALLRMGSSLLGKEH
jgi:hypothetical protein